MKSIASITALVLGLSAVTASATTITLGGGVGGYQFQSSTGVILTPTNATIDVGAIIGGNFVEFAVADATPPTFATTAALLGRWSGNASDNGSATADQFNGLQIWYRINVDLGNGQVGTALLSQTGNTFPVSANGVGDTKSVSSADLNVIDPSSTPLTAFVPAQGGNPAILRVGVVPEPSAALLGLLGAVGLLRRRR